jgi:hypothetical protein
MKIKHLHILLIVLFSLFGHFLLHAQIDTRGTDFWLAFGKNSSANSSSSVEFQIRVVGGDQPATGSIDFTGLGTSIPFTVAAGQVFTHSLSLAQKNAVDNMLGGINTSVHITSDMPITAYALNQQSATTDATNILPVPALGMEYYHISYQPISSRLDAYAVIATENSTNVYHNNTPVATLNKGQVYYRTSSSDMTGSYITADQPVAFFALNGGCNIPSGKTAADILFQQLAPVNTWGKNFYVPASHLGKDVVRIMVSQNGTNITQTGGAQLFPTGSQASLTNLQAGQWVELVVELSRYGCFIQADKPVGVCAYLAGQEYNGKNASDPSQAWLPAIEQTVKSALIAPFVPLGSTNLNAHYALIISPTATKDNTTIQIGTGPNQSLNATGGGTWYNHSSGYSFYSMLLTATISSYLFTNTDGLIVMGYGTGSAESYYYLASSAMRTLDASFYVNDIHNQDVEQETFCQSDLLTIRADIHGDLSSTAGFLKWYIDGTEETAARDLFTWTKMLPAGSYQLRMVAMMDDNMTSKLVETTLTTVNCLWADDDTLQIYACSPTAVLDVFANDTMVHCPRNAIQLAITSGSKTGALTSVDANNNIVYTPVPGFLGRDTLEYEVECDNLPYPGKAYITVVKCPDNINEVDCFGKPQGFLWDIKEDRRSTQTNVSTYVPPIVADLDGDSIPEILVGRFSRDSGSDRIFDGIYIFWGHNRAIPTFKTTVEGCFDGFGFSVARINGFAYPVIVMVGNADGYLYAYDTDPLKTTEASARLWRSSHPLYNYAKINGYAISFVDFDSDGQVEIVAGSLIFDAATGVLLAEVPAGGNMGYYRSPGSTYDYYFPIAADVTGDAIPEYIAGTEVYSVHIVNRAGTTGNSMTLIASIPAVNMGSGYSIIDGATVVADVNQDGRLDVVVRSYLTATIPAQYGIMAWDVLTQTLIAKSAPVALYSRAGIPLIGNIDNEPNIEIVLTVNGSSSTGRIDAFRWDGNQTFDRIYTHTTTDRSGMTGITLFDFNQDGRMELVYRDETDLRIMQANPGTGTFTNLRTFPATSGTSMEYPVVADIDNDGAAEIVVTGGTAAGATQGTLRIYKSGNQYAWAPARRVWNQYGYNVLNVNEDLTIPQYQMNPATIFPGEDGLYGTPDDVQPFNAFLQQQTLLNANGEPFFLLPDVLTTPTLVSSEVSGDSVTIKIGLINRGDAAIGSPVYVSLYRETTSPQTFISPFFTDSAQLVIMPGDTGYVFVRLPDVTLFQPLGNIVVRLNDDGTSCPYQAECDTLNNMLTIVNPAYHQLVKKSATLFLLPSTDFFPHNGAYSNPVATLFGEEIEYRLSAVNAFTTAQTITIRDTLPVYLEYVPGSSGEPLATDPPPTPGTPPREALHWLVTNVSPADSAVITFRARPQAGVSASQPMFINQAWVEVNGVNVSTNSTYHQGAGVSLVTFSAGFGGRIYNAAGQALDYGASPRSGVVVVPEEGYRFAGWRHPAYRSLRGETIEAQSGLMQYETLTVYGDVTLFADFEPQTTPVVYQIDGMDNTGHHPSVDETATDKIWAAAGELYVRTSKPGSIVRIYSVEGILLKQQIILQAHRNDDNPGAIESSRRSSAGEGNETIIKLPQGLYIVTLNNSFGTKIIITK